MALNNAMPKFIVCCWLCLSYVSYANAGDSSTVIRPKVSTTASEAYIISQGTHVALPIAAGISLQNAYYNHAYVVVWPFAFTMCPNGYTPYGLTSITEAGKMTGNFCDPVNATSYFDLNSIAMIAGTSAFTINFVLYGLLQHLGDCSGTVYVDYIMYCIPCGWFVAQVGTSTPTSGLTGASKSTTYSQVPINCPHP